MSDVPEINGWKPPVIYDPSTDETRIATQDDIDLLQRRNAVLGKFYSEICKHAERLQETFDLRIR